MLALVTASNEIMECDDDCEKNVKQKDMTEYDLSPVGHRCAITNG